MIAGKEKDGIDPDARGFVICMWLSERACGMSIVGWTGGEIQPAGFVDICSGQTDDDITTFWNIQAVNNYSVPLCLAKFCDTTQLVGIFIFSL